MAFTMKLLLLKLLNYYDTIKMLAHDIIVAITI